MAQSDELDDDRIPEAFMCPITHELMTDPVILIADSQTYERSAIEGWFATGRRISPLTGEKVGSTNCRDNYALKHAIEVSLFTSHFEVRVRSDFSDQRESHHINATSSWVISGEEFQSEKISLW